MAVEEHDDEDEDVEEEDDEDNEDGECGEREKEEDDDDRRTQAGSSISVVKDKSSHRSRTGMFQGCTQTRTQKNMTEMEEEEQEEEEYEEEETGRSCQRDSQTELHKVNFWHRRAHRQ